VRRCGRADPQDQQELLQLLQGPSVFSPLGSPLRLSSEEEQGEREGLLLEIALWAARAGGQDPSCLSQERLDCLLAQAREQFSWAGLAELEAAVLALK